MKILVIIPARGGSKGIPHKNIRPLGGLPVLAHTIRAAREARSIDRIVVSTDDDAIARVARQYGAEVVHRPPELSTDTAPSESALEHALDYLQAHDGYAPDLVVFLQATSPLRRPGDVQAAIEHLLRQDADSLLSATPFEGFIWKLSGDRLTPVNYDPLHRPRRQELDGVFLQENGSIYIFKPWVLRQFHNRLGGKIVVYPMDPLDSFQLDEPRDLELLEDLLLLPRRPPAPPELAPVRLLVLDFDGVMTDNHALVDQDGHESVSVNRSDGWGIARLREAGFRVVVLSTEANPVVTARCLKLGIECFQGAPDKLAILQDLARQSSLEPARIAYVGNDVNDLECLNWVGVPIAVADAEPRARAAAALVTCARGGEGAVREVAEWLLAARSQDVSPPAPGEPI